MVLQLPCVHKNLKILKYDIRNLKNISFKDYEKIIH